MNRETIYTIASRPEPTTLLCHRHILSLLGNTSDIRQPLPSSLYCPHEIGNNSFLLGLTSAFDENVQAARGEQCLGEDGHAPIYFTALTRPNHFPAGRTPEQPPVSAPVERRARAGRQPLGSRHVRQLRRWRSSRAIRYIRGEDCWSVGGLGGRARCIRDRYVWR